MAHLLETGKEASDALEDGEAKSEGPKHTREGLIRAAENGHLKIIKEFIEDRYESIDDKRQLCYELITVAEKAKQHDVVDKLKPYYKDHLKDKIPSDMEYGAGVRLNQHYKKILLGFLTGLGRIIAESPVVLDPADPNTYVQLFSNLTDHQKKRSQEIHKINSDRDAKVLSDQDVAGIAEKLGNINNQLSELHQEKESLQKNMQENSDKLKAQEKISASQRQDLFKQQEEHKKQLAVYECSIFLYELQQEATITRQNTVNFIRANTNLYLFFRTIENLLQSLFHASLTARSGIFTTESTSTAANLVEKVPTSIIPFCKFDYTYSNRLLLIFFSGSYCRCSKINRWHCSFEIR